MQMNDTKKIRVAVLYGGRSTEHEVSVSSALNVMANFDRSRFEVVPIKVDKDGAWFLDHQVEEASKAVLAESAVPQKLFTPLWLKEPENIFKPELPALYHAQKSGRLFDVIFPIMHGTFSEDGTIQGLLELADVPYVGSGVLASAIGMDKDIARRLVSHAGIQTVSYIVVKQDQWQLDPACIKAQIAKMFCLPIFVKPANQGSSIGVCKVKHMEDLTDAIEQAFRYDRKILIEQGISSLVELEVCLLESLEEGAPPFASLVGEMRPNDEYYTYAAKYKQGGVEIIVPADISEALQQTVRELSQKIFNILCAEGMSRIDFFVDKKTQEVYFNEINSIPGFTPYSAYPHVMTASGMPCQELLTRLVLLAIKRFEQKQGLERSYLA